MKIILAESGNEFELNNATLFSGSVNEIKLEIEKRVNTKASDQILISANGIQIKESDNKKITESILVVFNRRLLQDHACMDRLLNSIPQVTESLIESNTIPNLKELENLIYLYQVQEREQELFDTLDHIIQVCIQASNHRHTMIDQLAREINAQAISLDAALNNLESHVRMAHQNIGKFDRIAQREFAKHAIAIASIDLDIELLQNIQLHPRVCHISNSIRFDQTTTTLSTFVPIKELLKAKQHILKKYDELVRTTLEQKNKVVFLHQQTTNVSTTRTMSEIVIQRVSNIKSEVNRFKEALIELQDKIYEELKRRKRASIKKKKQPPFLTLVDLNSPPSPPRSASSADIVQEHSVTIQYPSSPPTTQQQQKQKKSTQNILRDAIRTLYLHETLIHQAEKSVIEEKQTSVANFVRCMQSISQVEESVTKIYPKLADLEKEIKLLRREIEKGKGATARKIIAGYGMLLIELWRRDKYTEIIKENANLLQNLFGEFGRLEQTYRKGFAKDVICLDKQNIFWQDNDSDQEAAAILPFQMSNIDDPPFICQTLFKTSQPAEEMDQIDIVTRREVEEYIHLVHSFYTSNNSSIMVKTTKSDKPSSRSNHTNKTAEEIAFCDVSLTLFRHLERETKRIQSGLVQLGLPESKPSSSQDGNNIASFSVISNNSSNSSIATIKNYQITSPTTTSAPLSPSNSSETTSFSDMKLASNNTMTATTPVVNTGLQHHLSNMSSTVLFQQQKDWEFEKASILRQSEEYRKYIEDLGIKHDQDRTKYEKDKQTLLRKLDLQEKRIEQVNQNHADQIQNFQMQLQHAEKTHKIKEREWKQQQERVLQIEQEKFDKRLNGFHQRMNAKDEEFARILLEERQTKSAPSSPTSSTFLIGGHKKGFRGNHERQAMVTQEQYDNHIQQLKNQIKELVNKHQLEIERLHQEKKAQEMEQLQHTAQQPASSSSSSSSLSADTTAQEQQQYDFEHLQALVTSLQAEKNTFDSLKSQMDINHTQEINSYQQVINQLKSELEETREKHCLKVLQMTEKNASNEERFKSLFINENQQLTMQCEARVANLVAEHENNLKELKEALENEKDVLIIQHQTNLEQEQAKWRKEWRAKEEGLEKEKQGLVEKVDFSLQQKERLRIEYAKYKKEIATKLRELSNLQQEQRNAKRIAKDVLSITSSSNESTTPTTTTTIVDMPLVDLLRKTLTNVSSLQSRNSFMEQSLDSSYNMMTMSSYGY